MYKEFGEEKITSDELKLRPKYPKALIDESKECTVKAGQKRISKTKKRDASLARFATRSPTEATFW